jgi:glycosyltransferase involved in cell wall biosynthesis
MKKFISITVVVPAFNEEERIAGAIHSVKTLLSVYLADYEILVVDDGSQDKTSLIVEALAVHDPHLRLLCNEQNRGLGYSMQRGFQEAAKEYVMWFPGDNSADSSSLRPMLEAIGKADLIVGYMANIDQRIIVRRYLSKLYTWLVNHLFGLNLRYYNGIFIFPRRVVCDVRLAARGHDIFMELLVRNIKAGYHVWEVPFTHRVETERNSKAISFRNISNILRMMIVLLIDIYILNHILGGKRRLSQT